MRDWLALMFTRLARRLTTWGDADDHLAAAERVQSAVTPTLRAAYERYMANTNRS